MSELSSSGGMPHLPVPTSWIELMEVGGGGWEEVELSKIRERSYACGVVAVVWEAIAGTVLGLTLETYGLASVTTLTLQPS